jgi:replicative DNA helicase
MAANKDLNLIAKIVDTGDLRTAYDAGIRVEKFADTDARLMWDYIYGYWRNKATSGDVPTREMLQEAFSTVDIPPESRISIKSTVDEFLKHDTTTRLKNLGAYIDDWADRPDEAIAHLDREIREMRKIRRSSTDIVVADSAETVKRLYEANKQKNVLSGIPYPWKILNDETRGMQDGEYIILYGRPKSEKTYLALYVATYAYDFASCNILIYTREMSPEQMMVRSVCFLIGAPYEAWKHGRLHEIPHPHGGNMEDHFHVTMDTMYADEKTCSLETGRNKKLIITSDREDRKYGGAVGGLQRKMEDFHPDLTVVDAVYLMKNDRDGVGTRSVKWGDQSAISQDLKDLAQDTKRVILATLQANRASEKPDQRGQSTTNLAYSDSYAQDTDLAIEIIKRRVGKDRNELALAITASRETNIAGFAIHGDPCNDFSMLEREVCDDMGVMKNPDGTKVIQPVIFQDPRDIKQFFWKNHIPHVLPNYDAPEESSKDGGGRRMKGPPSLHIPGR